MAENVQLNDFYEFETFRLDAKNCRLTDIEGNSVPLTPKEFDILLYLIQNAGRVVGKEELLEAVWKDAYVEEATLTRNVSWLRKKLTNAAAKPEKVEKIIETVPKRGYRFSAQVLKNDANALFIEEQILHRIQIEEIVEIAHSDSNENEIQTNGATFEDPYAVISDQNIKALPPALSDRSWSPLWIFPLALILSAAVFAVYLAYFAGGEQKVILAPKIAPFSGLPGRENDPTFSPDGKQIVFSWDGGIENGNLDVYVKLIGAGDPVRLTSAANDEINPVFSPDGKSIAFVRVFPDHNEIVSISALGGGERKIYDKASYASLSFSPDGKFLASADLGFAGEETGIFLINLVTGEKIRLTRPEAPVVDHTPRFSPDGKRLAFIRYFNSFRREIFIAPTSGGEPRQITFDDVRIYGLAWNADGKKIFYTSFRGGNQMNLWQISASEKEEPQLIPTGARDLQSVAISPNGRTIAFVEETADENIWQLNPKEKEARPLSLIRSTRADHSPNFSPDGSQIVFASDRTGNYEIWLADAEGKNQRQLSDSKASAGSPRFSPDGKFVVFDAQNSDKSDIYIVAASGGAPRRLTEVGKNNFLPAWSADGQSIFFISDRTGTNQIWKTAANSAGEAVQITRQGAFEMFATPDGKEIVYSKGGGKSGLWTVGVNGENEKPIPELAAAGAWRSWCIADGGVYYTAFAMQPPLHIKFFDLTTRQTKEIALADKMPLLYYSNLSVSADGNRILYARQDQSASSIMLAELN